MNTIILIIALLVKKPVDANYSAMYLKSETNFKAPKLKVGDRFKITNCKNNLAKVTRRSGQRSIYYWFCVKN